MVINFNKNIYPLKAIKKTSTLYKKLATFKITERGKYFATKLTNIEKDIKDSIKDEFCNHVLSQIK